MCGLLISSGSEVEIKGGRAVFGLDLARKGGMVWEQLTLVNSQWDQACMPYCDGIGGRL